MEALPTNNPCRSCGACCDFPEPWGTVDLTFEDLERIPSEMVVPSWGNWHKMAKSGNRCVALVGTVGVNAQCWIYDIRPEICRNFDPALRSEDCKMCRGFHGLEV